MFHNRKAIVHQALQDTGTPEFRIREALRNLGQETELWDVQMTPMKVGEFQAEGDDVEDEAL